MKHQRKKLTYITGYFKDMTPTQVIKIEGKPSKNRSQVTIETEDGQKLFLETRDAVISKIKKLGFLKNDLITVGIVFIGSEKKERYYNNLFLNDVNYARKE